MMRVVVYNKYISHKKNGAVVFELLKYLVVLSC